MAPLDVGDGLLGHEPAHVAHVDAEVLGNGADVDQARHGRPLVFPPGPGGCAYLSAAGASPVDGDDAGRLLRSRRVLLVVVSGVHCCPPRAAAGRCGPLLSVAARDATTRAAGLLVDPAPGNSRG